MIAPLGDVLAAMRVRGQAAFAFTCYDLATAAGVPEAAERVDAATILLVSSNRFGRQRAGRS